MSRRFLASCFSLLLGVSFLTGCATVNPGPFKTYAQTVYTAQTNLDKALSLHYDWVKSGYIENFQGNFSELVIEPGSGYDWTMEKMPLYLSIKKARVALLSLNSAYSEYVDLLVKLAELQVGDQESFKNMTRELNASANAALKASQAELSQDNAAIISVAAMEAGRLYIRSKHLGDLEKMIEKNQAKVDAYAAHCIALVHTLRSALKTGYVDKYEPIKRRWTKKSVKDESFKYRRWIKLSPEEQRLQLIEDMTDLNAHFADAMQLLQEIENLYKNIPKAHADLAKPVKQAAWHFDKQGLERLVESGKRLYQLYEELKPKEEN